MILIESTWFPRITRSMTISLEWNKSTSQCNSNKSWIYFMSQGWTELSPLDAWNHTKIHMPRSLVSQAILILMSIKCRNKYPFPWAHIIFCSIFQSRKDCIIVNITKRELPKRTCCMFMEPENSQVHLTTTIANTVQFAKLANCLSERHINVLGKATNI